jgi:hypothetical protein
MRMNSCINCSNSIDSAPGHDRESRPLSLEPALPVPRFSKKISRIVTSGQTITKKVYVTNAFLGEKCSAICF